jgi:hypothetical protein
MLMNVMLLMSVKSGQKHEHKYLIFNSAYPQNCLEISGGEQSFTSVFFLSALSSYQGFFTCFTDPKTICGLR